MKVSFMRSCWNTAPTTVMRRPSFSTSALAVSTVAAASSSCSLTFLMSSSPPSASAMAVWRPAPLGSASLAAISTTTPASWPRSPSKTTTSPTLTANGDSTGRTCHGEQRTMSACGHGGRGAGAGRLIGDTLRRPVAPSCVGEPLRAPLPFLPAGVAGCSAAIVSASDGKAGAAGCVVGDSLAWSFLRSARGGAWRAPGALVVRVACWCWSGSTVVGEPPSDDGVPSGAMAKRA
mmetsp:Transcript_11058/g.34222  ORF Transcript_11058/g.34222 Transcript_11058/m.34222 type:complete len:234 (-) Transcript_11058:1079-1780(-)